MSFATTEPVTEPFDDNASIRSDDSHTHLLKPSTGSGHHSETHEGFVPPGSLFKSFPRRLWGTAKTPLEEGCHALSNVADSFRIEPTPSDPCIASNMMIRRLKEEILPGAPKHKAGTYGRGKGHWQHTDFSRDDWEKRLSYINYSGAQSMSVEEFNRSIKHDTEILFDHLWGHNGGYRSSSQMRKTDASSTPFEPKSNPYWGLDPMIREAFETEDARRSQRGMSSCQETRTVFPRVQSTQSRPDDFNLSTETTRDDFRYAGADSDVAAHLMNE